MTLLPKRHKTWWPSVHGPIVGEEVTAGHFPVSAIGIAAALLHPADVIPLAPYLQSAVVTPEEPGDWVAGNEE